MQCQITVVLQEKTSRSKALLAALGLLWMLMSNELPDLVLEKAFFENWICVIGHIIVKICFLSFAAQKCRFVKSTEKHFLSFCKVVRTRWCLWSGTPPTPTLSSIHFSWNKHIYEHKMQPDLLWWVHHGTTETWHPHAGKLTCSNTVLVAPVNQQFTCINKLHLKTWSTGLLLLRVLKRGRIQQPKLIGYTAHLCSWWSCF